MSFATFWRRIRAPSIIIYADFIDPFCYIGLTSFLRAQGASEWAVDWRGFEFNPATPDEGWPLDTAGNSDLRPGMWASVQQLARAAGISFPEPRFISNTRRAHQLVRAASDMDVKKALIERIYRAYFNDQKDIGKIDVLGGLLEGLAMSATQAESAYSHEVPNATPDRYREEAKRLQLTGMPGFKIGPKIYFGALKAEQWQTILNPKRKEPTHV